MEDTSQDFKTDIVEILENILNQSKGPAKKVFQACLTALSNNTKSFNKIEDLEHFPFNRPIKEKLAVELRKRKDANKKREEKETKEEEELKRPSPPNSPIIRRKRQKEKKIATPPYITPPCDTPPPVTPPPVTPPSMKFLPNSGTTRKKTISKGFVDNFSDQEEITKQKSVTLKIQKTPKSGKIQNLSRNIRTSKVLRLKGIGTIPKECNQEASSSQPPKAAASSAYLRRSQRSASHSSSEDSLPDPQRKRVQCPECKEWMRYTQLAIHVREEHTDLSLSPGSVFY